MEWASEAPTGATNEDLRMRFDCRCNTIARAIDAAQLPMPLPAVPPPEAVPTDEFLPAAASTPALSSPSTPAPAVPTMSGMRERGMPPVAMQTPSSVLSPMTEQEPQQQPSPWGERPQEPSSGANRQEQQAPPHNPTPTRRLTRATRPLECYSFDGT